jgi:uncharacterized membrane protein
MSPKAKKIIGWVLAGMLALVATGSAFGKFTADPSSEMGQQFIKMGLFDIRFIIGGIELLCAILLLIPRTSTIGLVMFVGYWGGAIATHLSHGEGPGAPLAFLVLTGLIAIVRNPELLSRLLGKTLPA